MRQVAFILVCAILTATSGGCGADTGSPSSSATAQADSATAQTADSSATAETSAPAPTCTDGAANGGETGVDCGGPCTPCGIGQPCAVGGDCASTVCKKAKCVPPGWLIGAGGGAETVKFTTVLSTKLADPAALAFHPIVKGQLWVANRKDDSLVIAQIDDSGAVAGPVLRYADSTLHFLEFVNALSFVADGNHFASCGDSRNTYHGNAKANDFMGPALWPGDLAEFKQFGPDAASVHLDMMHDTPSCMGIASAGGTGYFVFNGVAGSIDWYDFGAPHVHGGDDHTDGAKKRYAKLGLARVANTPSHLAYDLESKMLYIADTGNGRIVRLDTTTGTAGTSIKLYPVEVAMKMVTGAKLDVVLDGLDKPSGLVLHDGYLFFTTVGGSMIFGVSTDGKIGATLDTALPAGALAGLAVGPDERLYFVDRKAQVVRRIDIP
ncbi:MAG: hypothetical protein EXR77_13365 [Myxococcales bacterium]|nr:hypothetical protein [Myxococcales bacterium]